MSDLPVDLPGPLAERLSRVVDVENKIPRALDALGPVADRDVLVLGRADGIRAAQLRELGARVVAAETVPLEGGVEGGVESAGFGVPDGSADVVVGYWSSLRGAAPIELAAAERALRPGGRLLVVHDYGRDDVSHLRGDGPEHLAWSRPKGPFLSGGFRVRVVHCFWTFDSMAACAEFLAAAFGEAGQAVAARLKRPRLSYNVAIYHRTFGEDSTIAAKASGADAAVTGVSGMSA